MIVIRIISAVLILAGFVFLTFSVSAFRYRKEFLSGASPARGVVAEVIRRRNTSVLRGSTFTSSYYYRVRYETGRGEGVEFVNPDWHNSPEYEVGEEVPVLYHAGDPAKAAINSFALLWYNFGMLSVLGACLLGAGACNLWITARPAAGLRTEVSLRELREAFRSGELTRDSEYQGLLVALTFVGFAFSGATILVMLFASATLKFILAALTLYTLVQIVRGRRGGGRKRRPGPGRAA